MNTGCKDCQALAGRTGMIQFPLKILGSTYVAWRLGDECDGCAADVLWKLVERGVVEHHQVNTRYWMPRWQVQEELRRSMRPKSGDKCLRTLFHSVSLLIALGICSLERVGNWQAREEDGHFGPHLMEPHVARSLDVFFTRRSDAMSFLVFEFRESAGDNPPPSLTIMKVEAEERVLLASPVSESKAEEAEA